MANEEGIDVRGGGGGGGGKDIGTENLAKRPTKHGQNSGKLSAKGSESLPFASGLHNSGERGGGGGGRGEKRNFFTRVFRQIM